VIVIMSDPGGAQLDLAPTLLSRCHVLRSEIERTLALIDRPSIAALDRTVLVD
jgi:hypothetical protein